MPDNMLTAKYEGDGIQARDPNRDSGAGTVVPINGNVTITPDVAVNYNGKTLVWSGAFTVTLGVGLPSNFGFAGRPPAAGNASVASINTGGLPTMDGATTTQTRTLANNKLFALTCIGSNSYTISGI